MKTTAIETDDKLHKFRLKALDKAKAILKAETISPMFFAELMLALPESKSMIEAYSLASDCNFFHAKRLLLDVAGVVISRGYLNVPDVKADNISDEAERWYEACKKAGREFVSDITIKESGRGVGMINLCPEKYRR